MTFATWYMLGLCYGFVPGDQELTMVMCQNVFESKFRDIKPDDLK